MRNRLSVEFFSLILVTFLFIQFLETSAFGQEKIEVGKSASVEMVIPVTIDAFEQLEKGCKESLAGTATLTLRSAEGDASKFDVVIKGALIKRPNFLVTVGTQLTNTAFGSQFRDSLPIVIATAITDPKLVDGLKTVGVDTPRNRHVAIISDRPIQDIYAQIASVIRQLKPGIKKVGILYNPSEINSKATAEGVKEALSNEAIAAKMGALTTPEDVSNVTRGLLLDGVEVVVIPHDKYAVEKAATIVQLCNATKTPVVSLDDGTVNKSGVVAAVSVNYRLIGQEVGKTIVQILHGKVKAEYLPVKCFEHASVYLNENAARKIELTIPDNIRKQAIIFE